MSLAKSNGINLHYQCKLCNLIKQDEELWKEVHHKVIKEKISMTVVVKWLNSKVDIYNKIAGSNGIKIQKFNNANFSKHFGSHVPVIDKMMMDIRNSVTTSVERGSTSFSDEQKSAADEVSGMNRNKLNSEMDEYRSISEMVSSIESRIKEYNESVEADRGKNGYKPNLRELEKIQRMVSELVSMKHNLIKLKSQSKISDMAIRTAVEMSVSSFLSNIIGITEEVNNILVQVLPKSSVPSEVVNLIRSKVGENMKFAIPEIIDKVIREYNTK